MSTRYGPFKVQKDCPIVFSSNGRLKPNIVMVNGQSETHPEDFYALDWNQDGKRIRRCVGKDCPGSADGFWFPHDFGQGNDKTSAL